MVWIAGGVAVAGAAAVTAVTVAALTAPSGEGPATADPAKIFTRADAAGLFAQSSQGTVADERSTLGPYPGEWTATGGAEIDYAFQSEGAAAAKSEVVQAGFSHAEHLDKGSVVEYGVMPEGCRLELAHDGTRVSVNDSDVHGDADCWSLMQALAITIDSRF
ncbi:hypothetical protein GCM10009838_31720 [Catenulispora subtropica]|uniref:Uncharacterized protein n=1 Tax=Catenulispora subtropica TaxID=450798 RepID=A0ABP5CXW4_9ACTN